MHGLAAKRRQRNGWFRVLSPLRGYGTVQLQNLRVGLVSSSELPDLLAQLFSSQSIFGGLSGFVERCIRSGPRFIQFRALGVGF